MTDRYCTNCRAELPDGADVCAQCGVFAGEVYDERRAQTKKVRWGPILLLLLAALAAAAWFYWHYRPRPQPLPLDKGPARVVTQRPGGSRKAAGATINEAEAIRTLRRELSTRVKPECLVVTSEGPRAGGYDLAAYDRCERVRLGKFRIAGDGTLLSR